MNIKLIAPLFLLYAASQMEAEIKTELFFRRKRYEASLAERDELCRQNKQLRRDSVNMASDMQALGRRSDSLMHVRRELQGSYKALSASSAKKLAEFSATLDAKAIELRKKELSHQEKDRKLSDLNELLSRQESILNYLNNVVKNAFLGFKSDEFNIEMKKGKVYVSLSDKLLFKSGSASMEYKAKEAIKKLSEVLNKNTTIDIAIEGHTDNVPIKTNLYKDNWDLSVARTSNIVRMICDEFSVDSKRVITSGRGENFPLASNESPAGRARNRRTDIVLSPKLEELFKILNAGK